MNPLLNKALEYYGLKEIHGENNNPTIMKFFEEIGHDWVQGDETAWCSAFINYIAKTMGYEYSGALDARSWLQVGRRTPFPFQGCVTVFWRESPASWKGHVGLFIRRTESLIYVLGGNQDNRVCIKPYPDHQLLDYRILRRQL